MPAPQTKFVLTIDRVAALIAIDEVLKDTADIRTPTRLEGVAKGVKINGITEDIDYVFKGVGFDSLDSDLITISSLDLSFSQGRLEFSGIDTDARTFGETFQDSGLDGLEALFLTGPDKIRGGSGDDVFSGLDGADNIRGGGGADSLTGDAGNDTISGGAGSDFIGGGGDNDTLRGRGGDDTLKGSTGDDKLAGGIGADKLDGGSGVDTLKGGAGADSLTGDAGADLLKGNNGADTLNGGAGADTLKGGDGADTLVFADGDGNDLVQAFVQGDDRIDLSAVSNIADFDDVSAALTDQAGDAVIDYGTGTITLEGVSAAALTDADFIF